MQRSSERMYRCIYGSLCQEDLLCLSPIPSPEFNHDFEDVICLTINPISSDISSKECCHLMMV